MKRSSTILQDCIVALGIVVLFGLLWEPHLEGRNADSTLLEVYFNDLFLAYAYLASIPFFVGLYHAFMVFGYAGQGKMLSPAAVSALRTIKHCALITAGAIVAAIVFLVISSHSNGEDPAGAVALGIVATLASLITAIAAAVLERVYNAPRTDAATA